MTTWIIAAVIILAVVWCAMRCKKGCKPKGQA